MNSIRNAVEDAFVVELKSIASVVVKERERLKLAEDVLIAAKRDYGDIAGEIKKLLKEIDYWQERWLQNTGRCKTQAAELAEIGPELKKLLKDPAQLYLHLGETYNKMPLRDWFAGMALANIAGFKWANTVHIADMVYKIADAMMERRKSGSNEVS